MEVEFTECTDPGIAREAAYVAVYNEYMCPRRLAAFRGFDDDGNAVTDTSAPLVAAVLVQDDEGNIFLSNRPCYVSPAKIVRVANSTQAADANNYIKHLTAKGDDGCEVVLRGSSDTDSGQWKLVWVASTQKWTTVPDETTDIPELCTTLMADAVLDPDNVGGFLLLVGSTAMMGVGVSLKINSYELAVTEVVDDEYVRVELITTLANPVAIEEGEAVCNIGYRPCPRTEEPYADTVVCCLDDVPVAIEMPADVNNVPVPGFWWRNQLGQVGFVAAPVNAVTGLIDPNVILTTPASPAAGVANLPSFRAASGFTFLSSPTTIYSQVSGGAPTEETQTVVLSGTSGFVTGAKAVLMSIDVWGISTSADYHAYIKINGVVRAHILLVASYGSQGEKNQFLIALPSDSEIEIEVDTTVGTPGTYSGFSCTVSVDGYMT